MSFRIEGGVKEGMKEDTEKQPWPGGTMSCQSRVMWGVYDFRKLSFML